MLLKYSLQNSQLDNERLPNLTRTKLHNLHLALHTSKNTECTSREKYQTNDTLSMSERIRQKQLGEH